MNNDPSLSGVYSPPFVSPTEQAQQAANQAPQVAISIPVHSITKMMGRIGAPNPGEVFTDTLHITSNKYIFASRSSLIPSGMVAGFDWQGMLQTAGQVAGVVLQFAPLLLAGPGREDGQRSPTGVVVGMTWQPQEKGRTWDLTPVRDPHLIMSYSLQPGLVHLDTVETASPSSLAAIAGINTNCFLKNGISAATGLLVQSIPAFTSGWQNLLKTTLASGGEIAANLIQAVQSC